MRPHTIALVLLFLSSAPALAMDKAKEPAGFDKAKFGMSPAQVQKLYKDRVQPLKDEHLGASPVLSSLVQRQVIRDFKLPGVESPVNVELRYWKEKLWVVIVYYGNNGQETVVESMRKVYGPPDVSGQDALWRGTKVQINTANRERWYAIADQALSLEAQALFMEDMKRAEEYHRARQGGAAPTPAPAAK
jgi:hypothetical protein